MDEKINILIDIWKNFDQKNDNFKLNPDREWVKKLALGVLENEKQYGLKYCPCRLTTGIKSKDIELICPCNFFIQNTWEEKGECWCGLFYKIQNDKRNSH